MAWTQPVGDVAQANANAGDAGRRFGKLCATEEEARPPVRVHVVQPHHDVRRRALGADAEVRDDRARELPDEIRGEGRDVRPRVRWRLVAQVGELAPFALLEIRHRPLRVVCPSRDAGCRRLRCQIAPRGGAHGRRPVREEQRQPLGVSRGPAIGVLPSCVRHLEAHARRLPRPGASAEVVAEERDGLVEEAREVALQGGIV
jgi:hypothetical protein